MQPDKILLISQGLSQGNKNLQPWRYLIELANGLKTNGISVSFISDVKLPDIDGLPFDDYIIINTRGFRRFLWHRYVNMFIEEQKPFLAIWNIGLTSFFQPHWAYNSNCPSIAIFTSPIYKTRELLKINLLKLIHGWKISLIHIIGSLIPKYIISKKIQQAPFLYWVTQTNTLAGQLLEHGLSPDKLRIIAPGIDPIWNTKANVMNYEIRKRMGFSDDDIVITYFGSTTPLRGFPLLLDAFKFAIVEQPRLRLFVIDRTINHNVNDLIKRNPYRDRIFLLSSWLSPHELASHVAISDLVALPFELLPSDAPLSVLEARSLGIPLVITSIACLPELGGKHAFIAEPSNPTSLARTLLTAAQCDLGNKSSLSELRNWNQVTEDWLSLIRCI